MEHCGTTSELKIKLLLLFFLNRYNISDYS